MEEAIPCVTCNFFLSCHISISCNISTLVNLLARAHIISCSILIARVCLIFTGIFSLFPSFFFFFLFFPFVFAKIALHHCKKFCNGGKNRTKSIFSNVQDISLHKRSIAANFGLSRIPPQRTFVEKERVTKS